MLYYVLKFFMFFVLRFYYRRIYVSGMEHLCPGKPVLICCNHANSFLDAFIPGTMLSRSLNYLARSDVFKNAFIRAIFRSFHMMPIYRIQEGKENLVRNHDTFSQCFKILLDNRVVIIYAEGLCIQEKRLRPLKKGTARIAFGAMEKGVKGLQIVPLGLNYTYPSDFRGEVILSVGKPFAAADFSKAYEESPAKGMKMFNENLSKAMMGEMIVINEREAEPLAEQLLMIARNGINIPFFRWKMSDRGRLAIEQNAVGVVNRMFSEHPEDYRALRDRCASYFDLLKKNGIDDGVVAGKQATAGQVLMLMILIPLMPLAYFFRMPPVWLSQWVTKQTVKTVEFYSSVLLSTGFIIFGLLLMATMIATGVAAGWWWGMSVFVGIPVLAYLSLFWEEAGQMIRLRLRWRAMKERGEGSRQELLDRRSEIRRVAGI